MRTTFKTMIMLAVILITSITVFAKNQQKAKERIPAWISTNGYWIVEHNIKSPQSSIIHFYNNDNTEIYTEKVEGIELNIKKRKTLLGLKKALDASLLAWHSSKVRTQDADVVKAIFKLP